jgi:hypothetical protein
MIPVAQAVGDTEENTLLPLPPLGKELEGDLVAKPRGIIKLQE